MPSPSALSSLQTSLKVHSTLKQELLLLLLDELELELLLEELELLLDELELLLEELELLLEELELLLDELELLLEELELLLEELELLLEELLLEELDEDEELLLIQRSASM